MDKQCDPVKEWKRLLHTENDKSVQDGLRRIYRNNYPTQAEIIFTPGCDSNCVHCIYPPDYAKKNSSIPVDKWLKIAEQLVEQLNIQTFVYSGRVITKDGIQFLKALREAVPSAQIGLIDNGLSIKKYYNELAGLGLDWIDISLDGLERDHDIQRAQKGSFQQALEGALWLKEQKIVPKVSILTCLTTINRNSVIPMIREVNSFGFKNFFITPVTVCNGYRPDRSLVVSGAEFSDFIQELEAAVPQLDDSWVELTVFDVEYMASIGTGYLNFWNDFLPQYDCLAKTMRHGDNDFRIHYYPSSLSGVTECIVNSDGNVILPKVMAKDEMGQKDIKGSLLDSDAIDIIKNFPDSEQFRQHDLDFASEKRVFTTFMEKENGF